MTNFDAYKDEIVNTIFAVVNGRPTKCDSFSCVDCLFNQHRYCNEVRWEWLKEEYVEPPVDWSAVKVDTPILVSDDNVNWDRRYFACYKNDVVHAWGCGSTSWSAVDDTDVMSWEYAKLAKVDE